MIERLYYVRCDRCGAAWVTLDDLADTSAGARKVARRKGWTRVPKRSYAAGGSPGADYCPLCKSDGAQ